jgi:YD repeat-containing protein
MVPGAIYPHGRIWRRAGKPNATLYWLDPSTQSYSSVPSSFDLPSLTLSAALSHFSDYLIGVGNDVSVLPTVDGFQTDLQSGTASVSIPLKVIPGPHGFQPSLTLTYSSGGPLGVISEDHTTYTNSQGSWVGFGWELTLGYVMLTAVLNPTARAYLVLNNRTYDLIQSGQVSYSGGIDSLYRTQNEEFLWIRQVECQDSGGTWRDYFLVAAKDGTLYRFGYTTASFTDPDYYNASSSRIDGYWLDGNSHAHRQALRYYLDQITDTFGNTINVTYLSVQGQRQVNLAAPQTPPITYDRWVYPSQITYTSKDPGGAQRSIKFNINQSTERQDLPPSTVEHYLDYQLDSIDEFLGGSLVRKYVFGYSYQSYNPSDGKAKDLILTSLTECDKTATTGVCNGAISGNALPSTTFQYVTYNGWADNNNTGAKCPLPLLSQVSNGYGGTVQYTYLVDRWQDNGGTNSGSGNHIVAQSQYWYVATKVVADGRNNSYTTTYTHPSLAPNSSADQYIAAWTLKHATVSDPFNNYPIPTYPEFRGYNYVRVQEPTGHYHDHSFFRGLDQDRAFNGSQLSVSVGRSDGATYADSEYLKGKPYEEITYDTSLSTILARQWSTYQLNAYNQYLPGNLPNTDREDWTVYKFAPASSQQNTDNGTSHYRLTTYTYDFSYGNLTDLYEYDSNNTSWLRHTKRWYYPGDNTANFNAVSPAATSQYVVDRKTAEDIFSPGSGDGTLVQGTWYCYDGAYSFATTLGSGQNGDDRSYQGKLTLVRRWYQPNGLFVDTSYTYDGTGNRLTEKRWNGYGSGSAQPNASDFRRTTTVYDATYNSFPSTITNPKSQTTTYSYDATIGKVTKVVDPNGATTQYAYDGFGRIIAVWAPGDDPTYLGAATVLVTYQMTPNQPYRVQIGRRKDGGGSLFAKRAYEWRFYDGIGRQIQTQVDFSRSNVPIKAADFNEVRTGVLKYTTTNTGAVTAGASVIRASDFNNLEISLQSLWTSKNLGSLTAWSGAWNAAWSSGVTPGGASWGTSKTPIYLSDLVDLRQWLNVYEFAAQPSQTSFTNSTGQVIVVNQLYDGRNLLTSASVPHLLSLSVCGQFQPLDWTSSSNPKTTYGYDGAKRMVSRTQPDGTSTFQWSYSGFTTTTLDENHHQKASTTDALGRLLQVMEYLGAAAPYTLLNTTQYTYYATDQLATIQDQATNLTQLTYDSLGRKTQQVDPDLGTWSYTYPASPSTSNPVWLLASQTDAKGQTISYQYEPLDRLSQKSGTNLATVTYTYDTGTNGVGRRTSMSDGQGTVSYTYDQRGRLTTLSRTIAGHGYTLSMTYDAQDRPLTLTYPNNDVLAYVYGDHGLPASATLNGAPLVTSASYNALKKLSSLAMANGLTTTWKYYGSGLDYQVSGSPNKWFGLPYQLQTGSLQNQTFPPTGSPAAYDSVGNPTAISYSDHTSEALTFSYNELDQLTSLSGALSENYGSYLQGNPNYDIGNLLNKGAITLQYPSGGQPRPHAPTQAGSVSYTYDANGNRSTDSQGNTYTYDGENHLTSVSGQVSLQNYYDGDGLRIIRLTGSGTTHYIGDWCEYDYGSGTYTNYYPFNGQPIAMKKGSTLSYLHHDHLGSLVAQSNAAGAEIGSTRYYPFGQQVAAGTAGTNPNGLTTDRLFTGQVRDLGDDRFYFFKSRYYDATIGKFQIPDTFALSMAQADAKGKSPLTISYSDPAVLTSLGVAQHHTISGASGERADGKGDPLTVDNPQVLNRYAYALDNPLKYSDDSGHIAWIPALILIGAGIGAVGMTANYVLNNQGHVTVEGIAKAAVVGAVAGGAGTAVGAAVAIYGAAAATAAGVGIAGEFAVAALSGAASGLVNTAVTNLAYGKGVLTDAPLGVTIGAVLGPVAQDMEPQVGFRTGYSLLRGLGSPIGGYSGPNTIAVYLQEGFADTFSQFFGSTLSPLQPKTAPGAPQPASGSGGGW